MEHLKKITPSQIIKIRISPQTRGIEFRKYGKYSDIEKYSVDEITEMYYGIYRYSKHLLVNGDYFIDLNDVIEAICVLEKVTYFKKPINKDLTSNSQISIKNIQTFYVKDYFLVTQHVVSGTKRHSIKNHLLNFGAIKNGRNDFIGLYSVRNYYKTLQSFGDELYPKDLYYPIKSYINRLFFNDDYYLENFKIESNLKITNSPY